MIALFGYHVDEGALIVAVVDLVNVLGVGATVAVMQNRYSCSVFGQIPKSACAFGMGGNLWHSIAM